MTLVANLYKSVPHGRSGTAQSSNALQAMTGNIGAELAESEAERRRREEREAKEEAKRRAKQAKVDEKMRREEESRRKLDQQGKDKDRDRAKRRAPFDFEKEKPNVLNSIAETSQAANNLVNALTVRLFVLSLVVGG